MAVKISNLPIGRGTLGVRGVGILPGLVKPAGAPVLARAAVRNSGGAAGYVELYLTNRTTAAPRFARTGPRLIGPGIDSPISLGWSTDSVPPGDYSITIAVDEVTAGGAFIRNLGADDLTVTFTAPAPAVDPRILYPVGSRVRLADFQSGTITETIFIENSPDPALNGLRYTVLRDDGKVVRTYSFGGYILGLV